MAGFGLLLVSFLSSYDFTPWREGGASHGASCASVCRTAPLPWRCASGWRCSELRQVELLRRLAAGARTRRCSCPRATGWSCTCASPDLTQARALCVRGAERLGGAEALEHLYEHQGEEALVHLFRVAASLDSMVLGEAQILGQVKEAFERGAGRGRGARES